MAYLDYNATAPLRPDARAAMARALELTGNPSSVHEGGRAARAIVEEARGAVAALAGARPEEVIFTSGGSEANALALWGAVYGAIESESRITRLLPSAIEHDSILATSSEIPERVAGLRCLRIAVTGEGIIDLDALRFHLREGKGRALVAVMAANNETGVIQPIFEVVRLAREAGALCLVDAVQACGREALDFAELGADYLSLSAHKLGGPQGVGALLVRDGAPFAALTQGGGQEKGRRPGTENVAGIAGFGAAAAGARQSAAGEGARVARMRDNFESELRRRFPDSVVLGSRAPRLANTSNFFLPDIAAETALMALDLDGVMVSSGAACSSGKVRPSHVLQAMGVREEEARCAIRVSFGWNSTDGDGEAALASLEKLAARVRARRAA